MAVQAVFEIQNDRNAVTIIKPSISHFGLEPNLIKTDNAIRL